MTRIRPARSDDAGAIARIHNQGIVDRQATFDTELRQEGAVLARIVQCEHLPLLVACNDDGEVVGWAGISSYRDRPCYAGVGEASVYMDRQARGRGIGRALLDALIGAARLRGYWKLVSRLFPENTASRALCRACGFREVGVYEKHACLDAHWRDVAIVERLIPENQVPGLQQREVQNA